MLGSSVKGKKLIGERANFAQNLLSKNCFQMKLIPALVADFENIYDGDPWFGSSYMHHLENMPAEKANKSPLNDGRTIHRIVLHVVAWRLYLLEKMAGNDAFDLQYKSTAEWPEPPAGDDGWRISLEKLAETQSGLLPFLQKMDGRQLRRRVAGRSFDMQHLLTGVLQHDVYHLGQIAFLGTLV